jgi:hypothetical protein
MKTTVQVFAALLLAIAVAACGGSGPDRASETDGGSTSTGSTSTGELGGTERASVRAKLIAEADAICRAHRPAQTELQRRVTADSEDLDANESAASRKALAEDLRRSSDVAEDELEELRELPPPPGEAPRLHHIILAAQAGSIGALIAAEAVESGDAELTEEAVAQTRTANEEARRLARDYGFQVCGRGLG